MVAPGSYVENLEIINQEITITSTGGPTVTFLEPANASVECISIDGAWNQPETEISGFTFSGQVRQDVIKIDRDAVVTVRNNIFKNNHLTIPATYNLIRTRTNGCVAYISRNVFYGNSSYACIYVRDGVVSAVNNTFDDNINCMVKFGINAQCSVWNNIFSNSTGGGVIGSMTAIGYNLLYNNSTDYSNGAAPGSGDIYLNPRYVNRSAEDFHLASGSPCINTGHPAPEYNDPDGSRNDMGAYPFGTSPVRAVGRTGSGKK